MGPVGSHQGTEYVRVPYGPINSRSVNQSYTDTGQSSDPSGLVGSLRAILGSDGFPSEMDCSTVPYRCTIDVRTPWARHGVPTGPPEARRDPTDPRRTPGGTVRPRLIGASRFGRPAAPIGVRQCTCKEKTRPELNFFGSRQPVGGLLLGGLWRIVTFFALFEMLQGRHETHQ